jgi:hypothetical protein
VGNEFQRKVTIKAGAAFRGVVASFVQQIQQLLQIRMGHGQPHPGKQIRGPTARVQADRFAAQLRFAGAFSNWQRGVVQKARRRLQRGRTIGIQSVQILLAARWNHTDHGALQLAASMTHGDQRPGRGLMENQQRPHRIGPHPSADNACEHQPGQGDASRFEFQRRSWFALPC